MPVKKVAILDIESVLLDAEFLPALAERVGRGELVHEITMKGIRGEIRWEEGFWQRIDAVKGARYGDAVKTADSMPYMRRAHKFCNALKKRGYTIIGVTGGFDLFANRVKEELGLAHVFFNELVFNGGTLVGANLKVTSENIEGLEKTLKRIGAEKNSTVAVIDGANTMAVFNHAGVKIAFNAQQIVKDHADITVDGKELEKLLPHFP
jgi:phosphoserine phosphatase